MKDRRGSSGGGGGDRFAVFPFSMGCMSQSAVSVADPSEKKALGAPSSSSSSTAAAAVTTATTAAQGSSEEGAVKAAAAATPRLVVAGVSRLLKGIRSLSQMFAAYDGGEEEEEEEREMVIGYPTDVQHVGHIGWDGGHNSKVGAGAAAMVGMVNAFSLPSALSLRHLDMAMDRAAAHASA